MSQSKPNYYERKYLTSAFSPLQLEKFILLNPVLLRPIYYPRQVISVYFDTPEMDYYQQNINGLFQRKKIRVRWYQHDQDISTIQMEVKLKTGEVISKITQPLETTFANSSLKELTQFINQWLKNSLLEVSSLQPVLLNSYQRRYYISDSLNIRLTLDSDLNFQAINNFSQSTFTYHQPVTILECKYNFDSDPNLSQLIQKLPLRVSKSSKYLMGISQCYPNYAL